MAQTSGPTSSATTGTTTQATSTDAQALNQIAPGATEQTPGATAQISQTLENNIASADAPAGVKGVDMGMIKDDLPNINPNALDASAAIQTREASILQQTNFRPNVQASAKGGPIGYTAMKFGQVENLNKPAAGQTATVHADAGEQLKVNFDPNAAQLSVRNGDLVFNFNDGSRIVVEDFVMSSNQMPSLLLPDGTLLAGGVVVAQLTGKNADDLFDIETAAGPGAGATGSGGFVYSDDLGDVINLLDKLPPIPFTQLVFPTPADQITPFVFPIDDAPGAQPTINNLVDETGGFNPNNPANTSNNVRTGTIIPDFGRDGAGSISLQAGFTADGSVAGGQLTSHGSPITSTYDSATGTITGKDAAGHTIFTMQVKPDGSYEFKLLGQIDHADKTNPDDLINLHFNYIVADSDGDTAIGNITIGVKDDGPVATPDVGNGVIVIKEYNVIGGAPDFPTLQEQKNLPQDRPDLFQMGTDKASNVQIDQKTTVTIDRFQSPTGVAGALSSLFAFTQSADGSISNIKLIFGNATANPENNGPTKASYTMETGGKLGFAITTDTNGALKQIGAIDANGNLQPGFTFGLKQGADGKYIIQYTHNGETKDLAEARFGGNFLGQDVHGVAGRQDGDGDNVLRYGFEDLPLSQADKDYNDVQFKVTVNPTYTDSAEPVKGNVLINDNSGADKVPGPIQTNDAVVTRVSSEINGFKVLDQGTDAAKGKFTTIQGEYGLLKIFENGAYEYQYNTSKKDGDLKDVFTYTMRDQDGDTSTTTLTINLGVRYDYTPGITTTGAEIKEEVLLVPGTDSVTKTITVESKDGIESVKLTKDDLPNLSADGKPVVYEVKDNGKTLVGTVDGKTVFTVELGTPVKQPDGTFKVDYTFTLEKPLDNPGPGENVTNIPVTVVVNDTDGDKITSTIPLKVVDDTPVAVDDSKGMGTSSVATGNIITNDNFGADGAAPNAPKVTSISYGAETKIFANADSSVSFTTPKGTLVIKADGSYTFTRTAELGELNETFNYSIKDADGDVSTAKLTITGNDNPVIIVTPNPQNPYADGNGAVLDEDDLPVPGVDSVTKSVTFTAPDGVASVKLTTDGLPALNANDKPVTYTVSADGKTLTGTAGGLTIFTVVLGAPVKQADGSFKADYTFTLQQPLDNPGTGENATNIPVKFVATDTDGDSAVGTLPLQVIDDVPVAANDSKAMGTASVANGNIITNDNFGADGAATNAPKVTSISYGNETKTFANENSVVSFTTPKGVLEIKADGSYTFTRNADLGELNETFNYSIKDADGDTSRATLTITGNDNPVVIVTPNPQDPYAGGQGAVLDEDDLPVPGVDSVTKSVTFTAPDGVASVKLTTDGLPSLTANDKPVTYSLSQDGKTLTGTAGGLTIFTVVLGAPVKQADGSFKADYTFTLQQPLDNPGTGENATNIPVKFVATDTDGDNAVGTLPLQVIDDVPVAANDSKAMGTSSVATGNIITNDNFGADGAATNAPKVTSISYGNETKTFANENSVVSFTTPKGVLEIKADGSYTFTRNADLGELNETFNYIIKDADGDTSSAKLTITGNDNPVTIVTPNPQDPYAGGQGAVLDEDDLPVPGVDSVTKSVTFTAPDGVQSVKLTADGLPNLTANDKPVTYTVSADGKTLTGTAGGLTIFTVVLGAPVKQADGSFKADYTFTLQQPLDNPGAGENVTNIPVKFVATDTDGDNAVGTLPLQVIDDVPLAADDSKAMGTASVATGNILTNDSYGADGFEGVVPSVNSITYAGVTKTFDSMTASVAFATPGGILEIKANGSYTFTRNGDLGQVNETFNYTIKDADGDISQAKLTITGNDNPVIIVTPNPQDPYAGGQGAVLDEDDLPVPGVDSVVKSVTFTAPDGVASVKLTADGLPALKSGGQDVSYTVSADGKTLTGTAGGQPVFTVVLNNPVQQGDKSYKADYTFTLLKPLDNPGAGENVTNIPVKFVATDTDGDSATGTLPLQVIDDVPTANDDANNVSRGGSVDGNVVTGAGQVGGSDTLSADGPNKITSVSGTSFANAQSDAGGRFVTIQGQYGTLKLYENGNYTYKHNGSGSAAQVDSFNYTLTDKDGDSDPAVLRINIANTVPNIPDLQGDKIIDETTDINKDIAGNIAATNASAIALGTAAGASAFEASGSLMGGKLTSNGQDVRVSLVDGKYVGYTGNDANASGAKVFELTLNGSQYNFKQFNNIDHANKSDPNDIISLKFAVTAKDADGDTDTGMLKIDIRDDAPIANPDTNTATSTIREFNVIGGAPDFPTLQEQKNLPQDRPDLYRMGVDKASNVNIDQPTTVQIERYQGATDVSVVTSPLFAFTQGADGSISNIQLIFGVASANPRDTGPTSATYQMTSGGKLGFFIAGGGTEAMKAIGAVDANGNIQPGFSYSIKANDHGSYDIQYTHNGETKTLYFNNNGVDALEARFAGDFLGQAIQGVAGRQDGDANNTLRYGFEDLGKAISDEDYNDVQIKVTINPIITEVTDPIHGNVLPNDVAGQDNLAGWQYGTKVTQVAVGAGGFINFAGSDAANDGEGKYISVKGEYGTLKIYEDGHYTYTYAGDKKDGDLVDDFRYTITDYDGDTSSSTLKVTINPATSATTMALLAASAEVAHAADPAPAIAGFAVGENDWQNAQRKLSGTSDEPESHKDDRVLSYDEPVHDQAAGHHDVDGQLVNDSAVAYTLGHQGTESALHADLTSHGEAVKTIVVDNAVHGFVGDSYDADNSRDVFKLALDQDGHYAFDMQGKIDQADAGTLLSFDYTAKDVDGSAIEGQVVIGVQGNHAEAVNPAPSSSLALHDLLDSPAAAPHTDVAMNTLSNADIVNSILDDDHPQNGYAGG